MLSTKTKKGFKIIIILIIIKRQYNCEQYKNLQEHEK